MKKTVYVNEHQGDDKNDGLAEDKPVLTKKRAEEIQRKEKTQEMNIRGTSAFIKKFVAEDD